METILSAPSMSNLKKYPSKQPRQTQCKCLNSNIYSNFFCQTLKTQHIRIREEESVEYDTIKQFNYVSFHLLLHNMAQNKVTKFCQI